MLSEFEQNKALAPTFIQGWYVDKNLTDYFLNRFKQLHNDKKTFKNIPPRNYYCLGVNSENFSDVKCKELVFAYKEAIFNYQKIYKYSSFQHEGLYGITKNDFMIKVFENGECYDEFHHEKTNDTYYRTLSTILYLNDIDEDGETEFFYQNVKIKPKQGLLIVWPAQWTHTHRGILTNENKYIISAYLEYFVKNDHLIDIANNRSEDILISY
jgi:prolyl 4-hydroxylase